MHLSNRRWAPVGIIRFLAHSWPHMFDWLPKVNGSYGIHSCTGPGNYEFPRNSF